MKSGDISLFLPSYGIAVNLFLDTVIALWNRTFLMNGTLTKWLIALVLTFSSTLPSFAGAAEAKALATSADLEADLLKERDRAEFNLKLAKEKLQKDADALAVVKKKYITTWRAVNLLVEDIQESIKKGKKPTSSKLFKNRAAEAEKTLEDFNTHVEKSLLPPEKQPKFASLLGPVAMTLVESL